MPADMFGDVTNPSVRIGAKKWYTLPLSIIIHTVILAAVVIIPLMAVGAVPTPSGMAAFVAAPPPPPPPPPPPTPPQQQVQAPTPEVNVNAAPVEAPREIKPEAIEIKNVGIEQGVIGGISSGTVGGLLDAPPPPPPPPPPPVRVGGQIKAPVRVKNVNPVYPSIAQSARVQGVVIIEATIGPDGRVTDTKVLRSIPLLDQAAVDAVKQWTYTPTLLNGVPVPVIMTVTVNFTLK